MEYHVRKSFNIAKTVVEVVVPANSSGPVLAAFVMAGDNSSSSAAGPIDESSQHFRTQVLLAKPKLRSSLPEFMLPDVFVPLKHVPLTPSGKVDRRTLREWAARSTRDHLESYATINIPKRSPMTIVEKTLHQIWACLLGVKAEDIGIVRQSSNQTFDI